MTQDNRAEEQAKAQIESIIEMVDGLKNHETREQSEQRIHEDALSVEVRSGWHQIGEPLTPAEFKILLCTGGPAVQITGELNQHNEPDNVKVEYQDWGTPWTDYNMTEEQTEAVADYARCFYFGD